MPLIGREQELQDLLDTFAQGLPVGYLYGAPGIGKTALALKLSERLKYRYIDRILYVDLSAIAHSATIATTVMSRIIWHYRPLEKFPNSTVEIQRVYLAVLQNQRVFIILDNFRAHDDIIALLTPPAGSLLLGIGHGASYLTEIYAKELSLPTIEEACTILNSYYAETGAFATAIVRACGYLPLAIYLAGCVLSTANTELSSADYCFRLQNETIRLNHSDHGSSLPVGLKAVLHLSYWRLSPATALLFRTMAVFCGSFDKEALVALCDTDIDEHLHTLTQLGLVQVQADNIKRFYLQAQVRKFALSCLSASEEFTARLQHASYYQRYLARLESSLQQNDDAVIHGLHGFDRECDNILAGQRWAAEQAGADKTVAKLCLDYLQSAIELRKQRLSLAEQVVWLESSLTAIAKLDNGQLKGWVLGQLGLTYLELGFRQKGLAYCQQHQKHCQASLSY